MPPKRSKTGPRGAKVALNYEDDDEYIPGFVVKKEEDDDAYEVVSSATDKDKDKGKGKAKDKGKESVAAKKEKKPKADENSNKKRKLEQTVIKKEEEESNSSGLQATEPTVKNHFDHLNDPDYDPYPQTCFYKMSE